MKIISLRIEEMSTLQFYFSLISAPKSWTWRWFMRQGNQDLHIENALIIFLSIFNNSVCFLLIILKILNLNFPLSEVPSVIWYYIIEKSNQTENVQLNSLFTKGELLCLSCTKISKFFLHVRRGEEEGDR